MILKDNFKLESSPDEHGIDNDYQEELKLFGDLTAKKDIRWRKKEFVYIAPSIEWFINEYL